jgi:hypothetical protein
LNNTSNLKLLAENLPEGQLDVRGIAPGIYFLRANSGGEVVIKKVFISR